MLSFAAVQVLYFRCRAHAVAECSACGSGWKPLELASHGDRFHCPGCASDLSGKVEQHYGTCWAIEASRDVTPPTMITTGDYCPGCGSAKIMPRLHALSPGGAALWGCGVCNGRFYRYRRESRRSIEGGAPVTPAWIFGEHPACYDVADLLDYGGEVILAAGRACERARGVRRRRGPVRGPRLTPA